MLSITYVIEKWLYHCCIIGIDLESYWWSLFDLTCDPVDLFWLNFMLYLFTRLSVMNLKKELHDGVHDCLGVLCYDYLSIFLISDWPMALPKHHCLLSIDTTCTLLFVKCKVYQIWDLRRNSNHFQTQVWVVFSKLPWIFCVFFWSIV